MKLKTNLLLAVLIGLGIMSCRNDDDNGITTIAELDRAEQQAKDNDTLLDYFSNHYYNSSDFDGPNNFNPNASIDDLVITMLEEGESVPDGHTLLLDELNTINPNGKLELHTTVFEDVDYQYYILRLNQGGGDGTPNFSDNVRVNFSGNLLDGDVFDSTVNPTVLDLTGLVPAWSRVVPQFNIAESFVENGDGTIDFYNAGVGAMFIPSGLGFWSSGATGVPVYSNLVFEIEIYQYQVNDHDGDGVPSYREDVNGDLELAGDDTDDNILANFLDPDDDGDGVLTINELIRNEYMFNPDMGESEPILGVDEFELSRTEPDNDGVVTITTGTIADANNDGTPDYLDNDITTDYTDEDN